ncbi:hypothetical protein [methane-oxidizing endosymbiont of Gigantopelta aegis]|uniref:hypothetical protein n=1 Tax=methane-oxidizing endosymbiont of Gigantopelta aegis TaxID=2794938 RepID=UPI0018DAFA40|nr:hypothetical protein [methane-oxidizing endosymbiont of Gigantopelta aegis]
MLLRFFLGWLIATSLTVAWAEETQKKAENNMLYSRSSKLSVDNINKATTVLRDPVAAIKKTDEKKQPPPLKDPTQINQNFLQALKNSRGKSTSAQTDQQALNFPAIRLLGKIYHPKTARQLLIQGKAHPTDEQSSIVLQIDGDVVHLHEGDSSSVIKNNQLYTIEVEAITPNSVTLILNPAHETLVLH